MPATWKIAASSGGGGGSDRCQPFSRIRAALEVTAADLVAKAR